MPYLRVILTYSGEFAAFWIGTELMVSYALCPYRAAARACHRMRRAMRTGDAPLWRGVGEGEER